MSDTRAAWLADRKLSMGASDIAAADTGRYGGAAKAVASKLDLPVADEIDPDLAARGHRWEQPVADGVLAHYGLYVLGEQMLVRNPATPWVHTTVDGMLAPTPTATLDDITANLETKTRSPHAPWPWDYWRAQGQVGMHCTGAPRCLLAIATVDTDYDVATGQLAERLVSVHYEWVDRDQLEIDRLVALAADLWAHVERGELPEPTGPEALPYVKAATMAAGQVCPTCGGTGLHTGPGRRKWCATCGGDKRSNIDTPPTLDADLSALIARREQLAESIKTAQAEADTIEARLRLAIGEATEVHTTDGAWRVRCGTPVRKFTSRSEADFLDLYGERALELGLLRTVLDRDRAKAEMPDEYDALRIATPDRRLTVKNLQEDTP